MATGKQTLVGFAGAGLIAANYVKGTDRASISTALFGGGSTSSAHTALVDLSTEVVAVLIATVIAGASDSAADVVLVLLVILWVLWLMNNAKAPAKTTTSLLNQPTAA
jgi:hypothetical protein